MEQKLEELAAKIDELLARVEALENRLDEKEAEETAEEAAAEEAAAETPEQAAGAPDIAEFTKRLAKKVAPADRKPYVETPGRSSRSSWAICRTPRSLASTAGARAAASLTIRKRASGSIARSTAWTWDRRIITQKRPWPFAST